MKRHHQLIPHAYTDDTQFCRPADSAELCENVSISIDALSPSSTRPQVTTKLVTALVLSRLDHCNAALARLPATTLAPLQSLACSSTYCSRLKAWRPCHSCFAGVALVADHRRIQYKLCLLVHKIFVGHAPDYIASQLTPASDIFSLRSSSNCDLVVPRTSRKIGDRAFSVAVPHACCGIGCRPTWNSCVRLLHSRALNSFLFHAALGTLCKLWNAPSVCL